MKIHLSKNNIHKTKSDLLVFTLFANEQLSIDLKKIDKNLNGTIIKTFKENKFKGQYGKVYRFNTHGLVTSKSIVIIGLGDKKEFKSNRCYRAFAAATKEIKSGEKDVGFVFELNSTLMSSSIEGLFQGSYQFNKYKTGENAKTNFELTIFSKSISDRTFSRESRKAIIISKAVHLARDIVNEPPVYLTPAKLAEISEAVAIEGNLAIKVLGKDEIKSAGMNGLYSVSRGSTQPPRFIHFTYTPKDKSKKTVAIVGKGVTFDSGGLCLKPAGSMLTMKMDMAAQELIASRLVRRKMSGD